MKNNVFSKISFVVLLLASLPLGIFISLSVLDNLEASTHAVKTPVVEPKQDIIDKVAIDLKVNWTKLEVLLGEHASDEEIAYIIDFWSIVAEETVCTVTKVLEEQDEESIQTVFNVSGLLFVVILLFVLVIKGRKKLNQDSTTKFNNREYLLEELKSRIKLYKRMKDPFCVLFITIDNLSHIGEAYGKDKEEHILKNFALIATGMLRDNDLAFRYSEEEFVILAKTSRIEEAYNLAERLRTKIEAFNFDLIEVVTISIGISEFFEEQNIEGLLADATSAMSQAKAQGRNKTCIYKH